MPHTEPKTFWFTNLLITHTWFVFAISLSVCIVMSVLSLAIFRFNLDSQGVLDNVVSDLADRDEAFNIARGDVNDANLPSSLVQPERSEPDYNLQLTIIADPEDADLMASPRLERIQALHNYITTVGGYTTSQWLEDDGTPAVNFNIFDYAAALNVTPALAAEQLSDSMTPQAENLKFTFFGKDFGNGSISTSAMRLGYFFGVPLKGYNNTKSNEDAQEESVEKFIVDSYYNWVVKQFREKDTGLTILYSGSGIITREFNSLILRDGLLAVVGLIMVFFYMWFHLRSCVLAFLGILEICLAFPTTLFITQAIFQQRVFATFNFLALYVIVAIGTDDEFVFMDAWRQSAFEAPVISGSLKTRLAWAYKKSTVAMLITTITTAGAFYANAFSIIPSIRNFGVFAGTIILVDYAMAITFWPACVILANRYCKSCCCCCFKDPEPEEKDNNDDVEGSNLKSKMSSYEKDQKAIKKDRRWMEIFFEGPYSTFVFKARFVIIVLFIVFIGVTLYFATTLEPLQEAEAFLPDSHPIQQLVTKTGKFFLATESAGGNGVVVSIVWGITGLDRSRADFEDAKLGEPVYDSQFTLDDIVDVQSSVISTCDSLALQKGKDGNPLISASNMNCFMTAFRDFWVSQPNNSWPITDKRTFVDNICSWKRFAKRTEEDTWNIAMQCQTDGNGDQQIIWFSIFGFSSFTFLDPADTVRPVYESMQEWSANINALPTTPLSLRRMYQTSPQYVGMEFEEQIVKAALVGLGISLGIVAFVLIIATSDILISFLAFFSICGVVCAIIATMVWIGWDLGIVEAISIAVLAGLSVDYTLHLAIDFRLAKANYSKKGIRLQKIRNALGHVGISLISASITTFFGSVMLFFAQLRFFFKFGAFMVMVVGYSLIFAFLLFVSLLAFIGPRDNRFSWWYWLMKLLGRKVQYRYHFSLSGEDAKGAIKSKKRKESTSSDDDDDANL